MTDPRAGDAWGRARAVLAAGCEAVDDPLSPERARLEHGVAAVVAESGMPA